MQEGYDPTKYYLDVENGPFCSYCQRRHNFNHIEEVIMGSEQGTIFPTKVGSMVCHVLIDTGNTRCCMSEAYYRKLQLLEVQLLHNVSVWSVPGSNLALLGLVKCTFLLGDMPFEYSFIVCRNLTRPLILGRNILAQNQAAVRYLD